MNRKFAAPALFLIGLLCFSALAVPGGFSAWTSAPDSSDPAAQLAAESGLAVISITTDSGSLPGSEDSSGRICVYQPRFGRVHTVSSPIEIRERGNTSRRFPKKSYRVKIVDEHGEKANLSLLGMRSDDDWILNPMYSDTSKIREALAYALWDEINTSSVFASSSRVEYAEVYINGEYRGLYGLQERIDRKQVDSSKQTGILYKVIANDRPCVSELTDCTDLEVCRGIELEFAGAAVKQPWEPAAAYMALLNGEPAFVCAALSVENTIDYGLWAMLCQAHDCHFKNQFINCVYEGGGYTLYKIPWDLNNTFGDVWKSDAKEANYTDYRIGGLVKDASFEALLNLNDHTINAAVQERWKKLRSHLITEENLTKMAYKLYNPLKEALVRDSERWPSSGMGNGNAANIRDIESYIAEILPKMDAFIFGLETQ